MYLVYVVVNWFHSYFRWATSLLRFSLHLYYLTRLIWIIDFWIPFLRHAVNRRYKSSLRNSCLEYFIIKFPFNSGGGNYHQRVYQPLRTDEKWNEPKIPFTVEVSFVNLLAVLRDTLYYKTRPFLFSPIHIFVLFIMLFYSLVYMFCMYTFPLEKLDIYR